MKKILFFILTLILVTPLVYAGSYDLKKITPEIKKALDDRRSRFSQLETLMSQEKIGEGNKGYVIYFNGDDKVNEVASAENQDRRTIYEAILKQNKLPLSEISTVEKVFAETQRTKASKGHKIQLENGDWATKA